MSIGFDYILNKIRKKDDVSLGGSGGIAPTYNDLDPVISQTNTPPAHVSGERYLIGTAPTGAWVGKANQIAESNGAAWTYTIPVLDDYLYVTSTLVTYRFNGTIWVDAPARALLQYGNTFGTAGARIGTNNAGETWLETNNTNRVRIDGTTGDVRIANSTKIGDLTSAPNSKAILDLVSTTKAFLPPRMTTVQRSAITSPAEGSIVYDTDLDTICIYTDPDAWVPFTLAGILLLGADTGPTPITGAIISLESSSQIQIQTVGGGGEIDVVAQTVGSTTIESVSASDAGRVTVGSTLTKIENTTSVVIDAPSVNITIGASGTFTTVDLKTVTVTNGIITAIV